jgi:hypothetical protein
MFTMLPLDVFSASRAAVASSEGPSTFAAKMSVIWRAPACARGRMAGRRVVDHHVQAAESIDLRCDGSRGVVRVGNVRHDEVDARTLIHQGLQRSGTAAGGDHPVALAGEVNRRGATDAGASAGDENDLGLKFLSISAPRPRRPARSPASSCR